MTGVEHILVAMKPCEGSFADNALKHGVAGLWIDGCRVATSKSDFAKLAAGVEAIRRRGGVMNNSWKNASDLSGANPASPFGRWPANVILGHSADCVIKGVRKVKGHKGYPNGPGGSHRHDVGLEPDGVRCVAVAGHADADGNEEVDNWDCDESCPARLIGEQSGECKSGGGDKRPKQKSMFMHSANLNNYKGTSVGGDSGTAVRFFKQIGEFKHEQRDECE